MAALRFFVVPGVLLAASVGYVMLNPSGGALEPIPTKTPTSTPRPTYTPRPTATPVPVTLDLQGTLAWQPGNDPWRAVEFPSGAAVRPPRAEEDPAFRSYDGTWERREKPAPSAPGERLPRWEISFRARDGRLSRLDGQCLIVSEGGWAPASQAYAFGVADHEPAPGASGVVIANRDPAPGASRIVVVEDPAAPVLTVAYSASPGTFASAFAWYGDDLIVAEDDGTATRLAVVGLDGTRRSVGDVALDSGAVWYLDDSPDGHTYAFTIAGPDTLRLMTVDARTLTVTDHGAIAVVEAPPEEDSLAPCPRGYTRFSWSPDGSRLVSSLGSEPPYIMTVVDVASGTAVRPVLPPGILGEMAWSPDGAAIAVSVCFDRTHHETWIVDPATGLQHRLIDGSGIVWSPDSRFLAVRGEDRPGIAIIEVATGARMQLTHDPGDIPISWTE
jgi:hypothetical protein